MKHLLLFTEYFPTSENAETTGGVENRMFYLVKGLQGKYKITVLASRQPGQEKKTIVFGANVLRPGPIIPYSHKGYVFRRLATVLAMFFKGLTLRPDIVDGGSFMMYWQAFFVGLIHGAKKCATWHETWVGEWVKHKGMLTGTLGSLWERIALKLPWDVIITVSNATKQRLINNRVLCKNIHVIPNGFDYEHLQKLDEKKHKKPTLVFLGRLTPQKDVGTLLRAVKELEVKIPDIQCHIVGGGPCEDELKQLAKELNIEELIVFFGYQEKHVSYLKKGKACHVFVSPSLLEGFGIALVDAMAMRLPVVVSDIEPFKEVTQNGKGGFLFRQKNYKDLAQKVSVLFKNKKVYQEKQKEAEKLAKQYDWQSIIRAYEKLYD